ncbi:MAG: TetR/AcrR family transcriptional regulator [Lachnospiraceae bacterium]
MDLRVKRTKKNIRDAFLTLRSKKDLEKITVTELADLAGINKATFYLHYKDIYDLSERIEDELIEDCLASIKHPEDLLKGEGFSQLALAYTSQSELFSILFSGSRANRAIQVIDKNIRERVYEERPEYRDDFEFNMLLTALTYGIFYAFTLYMRQDFDAALKIMDKLNREFVTIFFKNI